jgi:hypothetical protein
VLKFDEGPLISGLFVFWDAFLGAFSGAPHGSAAISLSGSRCFGRQPSRVVLSRRSSADRARNLSPLAEFGSDDVARDNLQRLVPRTESSREGARSFVAGASDRATPNILPDKILHRGEATRADPNENEHTPLVWKPAHPLLRFAIWQAFAPNEYCGAAHGHKNVSNQTRGKKFLLNLFCSDSTAQRALLTRNGCATILPSDPTHQTSSCLERLKQNNRRSRPAA